MKDIENYIEYYLKGEMKQTALSFVKYLRECDATFYRDTCGCRKDKLYSDKHLKEFADALSG